MCSACAPIDDPQSDTPTNAATHGAPTATVLPTTSTKPADGVLPERQELREDTGLNKPAAALPDALRQRIDAAIDQVQRREVQTSHGFWTVFHALLGVGSGLELVDPHTGRRVSAIDHISSGGELRGMRFIPTPAGLDVQIGPMFVGQGHADQFVAEMLQVGLAVDHPFLVDGRQYILLDFIRHTQSRVRVTEDQELSWAIVAIGQCLGTDVQWTNRFGESLRFEDLVRYELDQDVEGAACGGTHRLFGLHWVYQLHLGSGGAATGVWQEVVKKMKRYQDRARELQNPDGSFSTDFFRGSGSVDEMQQRINSSGHIFEWLALSLSDEELQAGWVREAANALAQMILEIQSSPMEGGTLYHATHGLRLYRERCSD
ncbi:MAG: hypothetical protein IT422_19710 [Pirellulaceae bacterium]|nr:hypothetical protein [Pirellulaceae bacterium]